MTKKIDLGPSKSEDFPRLALLLVSLLTALLSSSIMWLIVKIWISILSMI